MRYDTIIKSYAERLGMGFMFERWEMANVKADKPDVDYPLLVFVMPATGRLTIDFGLNVLDEPQCLFAFLTSPERMDYDGEEGAPPLERMKSKMLAFINAVNTSGDFEPLNGEIEYQTIFHRLDRDLMGVMFEARLTPTSGECLADYK